MANIYNEPGSADVIITLKNNDYSYLNTHIGIAKMCLITDQKKFGYSDLNGNLKKCLTDASGSSVTPENCVFIADSEGSASHSTTFVYNDNKLGVNIAAPQNRAHFHEPSTGNCLIQITNASRGSSDDNDGMTVGIVGDDNVIRTTYNIPIKIQVEDNANPGTFVDLATFQDAGWHQNTILDTDLTVSIIPAKTAAASVFLTHENNTIKTRTAAEVLDDIGAASVEHVHAIADVTELQTTLDDKQATITGTGNKVLSIQAGGTGVKTGSLYDNGNVVRFENGFVGNSLSTSIRHYHDVYLYNNSNTSETGILKITMPQSWSNTFMRITIKGYNYVSGQGAWECIIGGYNYNDINDASDQWVNYSAEIRGSAPFSTVKLGYDGSKCVILLGNADTYWRYAKVAISDMMAGGAIYGWETGWSAEIITSETGLTKIATPITSIYGNNATIPNTALIGKTTATPGGGYRLEVEGNTLVTGYTASIYPSNNSVYYRDVYQYSSNTMSITGIMKFTLPKTWANTMLTFTIKGYDYLIDHDPGAWECIIGGYNHRGDDYWPDGWYNCTAEIRGFAPFSQVRLAHDGTKCCLLLGDTSTYWHYPQVAITEVFASYDETSGWGEPYSMSFITSETGLNSIATSRTIIYGDNDLGTVWFDYDTNVYGVSFDLIKKVKYKKIGRKIDILYSFKKSSTALSVGYSFSFIATGYYSSFDDTFYSGICINSNGEQVGVVHMKPNDGLLYVTITKATNEVYGSFTFYGN